MYLTCNDVVVPQSGSLCVRVLPGLRVIHTEVARAYPLPSQTPEVDDDSLMSKPNMENLFVNPSDLPDTLTQSTSDGHRNSS